MRFLILAAMLIASLSATASSFVGGVEALHREVLSWSSNQLNQPQADISVGSLNANIQVKPCPKPLTFSFPFNNQRTVQVQCNEQWKLFLKLTIQEKSVSYVAAQDIKKGSKLTAEWVVQASQTRNQEHTPPHPWVDLFAARDINEGEAVTATDFRSGTTVLRTNTLIARGQTITPVEVEYSESLSGNHLDQFVLEKRSETIRLIAKKDMGYGTVLTKDNTRLQTSSVVAAQALPSGTLIDADAVEVKWIDTQDNPFKGPTHLDEIIGLETTRQIRPQERIRFSDVTQATLIHKGNTVKLTITRGAMKIEVDTIALEAGQFGEQIDLLNPESGQTVRGTVSGQNRADGSR